MTNFNTTINIDEQIIDNATAPQINEQWNPDYNYQDNFQTS